MYYDYYEEKRKRKRCASIYNWLNEPDEYSRRLVTRNNFKWVAEFKEISTELDRLSEYYLLASLVYSKLIETQQRTITKTVYRKTKEKIDEAYDFLKSCIVLADRVKGVAKLYSIDTVSIEKCLTKEIENNKRRLEFYRDLLYTTYIPSTPLMGYISYLGENGIKFEDDFESKVPMRDKVEYSNYVALIFDVSKCYGYNYLESLSKNVEQYYAHCSEYYRNRMGVANYKHVINRDFYIKNVEQAYQNIINAYSNGNQNNMISDMEFSFLMNKVNNLGSVYILCVVPTYSSRYLNSVFYISSLDGSYSNKLSNAYCASSKEEVNEMLSNFLKKDLLGVCKVIEITR